MWKCHYFTRRRKLPACSWVHEGHLITLTTGYARWLGLIGAFPWLRVSPSGLWPLLNLPGRAKGWGRLREPFGSHHPPHSLCSSTLVYSAVCACRSLCLKCSSPTWSEFLFSFHSDWPSPVFWDTSSYWPFKTSLNIYILIPVPCSAFFLTHTAAVTWYF